MRKVLVCSLLLALLAGVPPVHAANNTQKCFEIHGRAILYRGDGFFAIWHVGTHHVFFPADKADRTKLPLVKTMSYLFFTDRSWKSTKLPSDN